LPKGSYQRLPSKEEQIAYQHAYQHRCRGKYEHADGLRRYRIELRRGPLHSSSDFKRRARRNGQMSAMLPPS
jgi:hypothetical protein